MPRRNPLKPECIRLRVEERLSLPEIHRRTGVSRGSLSLWLRDSPLTDDEKAVLVRQGAQKAREGIKRKYNTPTAKFHKVIRGQKMTTLQKAKISEAAVLFRLVVHGYSVYGSPFDGDRTDWIVETPAGKVWKIQVKTAVARKCGRPGIKVTRSGPIHGSRKRYKQGEFDFLVGYDMTTDTAYVFSFKELEGYSAEIAAPPESTERWDKLG